MASVQITLTLDGDKNITKALADLDLKAKNPQPFYQIYGAYMRTIPLRAIREQSDPVTLQPWPARKSISLLSRRGGGGKMLQDTTALLRSFNQAPLVIDQNGVSVGTDLKYAITHQLGMEIKARKQYLTIPMEPNVGRLGIRAWFKQKADSHPFFYHSKKGTVLAAYSVGRGKNKKLKFAWLLTKSIVVPRRRFAGYGKRDKEQLVTDARTFFSAKGN